MTLSRRAFVQAVAALATAPARRAGATGDRPVIAAASVLQFALPELADAFAAETGQAVRLSFGSSGNLSRQIREGAPFQLFLSADEEFIAALHADGVTPDAGTVYAEGQLALIAPRGGLLTPDAGMDDLARLLDAGRIARFAIANPEHAPYGMRAREALETRGLWEAIRPALVLGENVSQAAQFALSGNAEGGLVALSLALAPQVAARGVSAPVPRDWHLPLRQRMALLPGAGDTARAFHAYLLSPPGQAILSRHGFGLPGA